MFADEAVQIPDTGTVDPEWAWEPYRPDTDRPWDLRRAAHLFRRAAFGSNWSQLQTALAEGPAKTIDKLLHPDADLEKFNQTYDGYEASTDGADTADNLRAWWLRRMIETPHPLQETMTLFWHGHIAISNVQVNSTMLMRKYIALLRNHALGRYQAMLEAVSEDPAVLLGLDCDVNRKSIPNDNFARGLMETFALGLDNFSENDVREAARAFTGWFVLRNEARFVPREHDAGTKKVLGQEGNFTDKDVVRIVLQQPAAPRFLVRKVYRWLVSENGEPTDTLIEPLATTFGRDYDIGALVETIIRSNLFFSAFAYRQRVKSPVEFTLGIVKSFEELVPTAKLGQDIAALGQNLLHPPTVTGWSGGPDWIHGATMLGRANLGQALLSGEKPYGHRLNPLAVAEKHGFSSPDSARDFLVDLLLQNDLPPRVIEALKTGGPGTSTSGQSDINAQLRRFAHEMVTLPEFQLS